MMNLSFIFLKLVKKTNFHFFKLCMDMRHIVYGPFLGGIAFNFHTTLGIFPLRAGQPFAFKPRLRRREGFFFQKIINPNTFLLYFFRFPTVVAICFPPLCWIVNQKISYGFFVLVFHKNIKIITCVCFSVKGDFIVKPQ